MPILRKIKINCKQYYDENEVDYYFLSLFPHVYNDVQEYKTASILSTTHLIALHNQKIRKNTYNSIVSLLILNIYTSNEFNYSFRWHLIYI